MSQATIQSQLLILRINFLLVEIPIPHIRNSYYLPILDINNLLVSSDLWYVKLVCDIDMWNKLLISTIDFEWQPMVTFNKWKYNYR